MLVQPGACASASAKATFHLFGLPAVQRVHHGRHTEAHSCSAGVNARPFNSCCPRDIAPRADSQLHTTLRRAACFCSQRWFVHFFWCSVHGSRGSALFAREYVYGNSRVCNEPGLELRRRDVSLGIGSDGKMPRCAADLIKYINVWCLYRHIIRRAAEINTRGKLYEYASECMHWASAEMPIQLDTCSKGEPTLTHWCIFNMEMRFSRRPMFSLCFYIYADVAHNRVN